MRLEDQPGHRLARLAAFTHGDAQVGPFDRQYVIDAVADHGHIEALLLQRFHDGHLLLRRHPAKNAARADQLVAVGRRGQFGAGHDRIAGQRQVDVLHRRLHSFGIVAGDDLEGDALGVQSFQDPGGFGPQFVAQADQAQRPQATRNPQGSGLTLGLGVIHGRPILRVDFAKE